mgnify:CR=1 FL=1
MTAIKDDYYHVGLTDEQVRKSREEHGVNLLTPPKRPFFMEIVSGEV